jgi:hypothetical protein
MATKQEPAYFRYTPPGGSPQGPMFNPFIGDVEPGCVYEVAPQHVARFSASNDWEPAKRSDFGQQ